MAARRPRPEGKDSICPAAGIARGVGMTVILEREEQLTSAPTESGWHRVCPLDELEPAWGEAALIDGVQVALFRLDADNVYAVAQQDPATLANVMARGSPAPGDHAPLSPRRCTRRSTTCRPVSAIPTPGSGFRHSGPAWLTASSKSNCSPEPPAAHRRRPSWSRSAQSPSASRTSARMWSKVVRAACRVSASSAAEPTDLMTSR
ncbi:nitrite reductase (NADH) small subunit [Arthrobacter sp. Hiyo8]|nr:nitrite reductase (NADH) small subunit [Arthrobacter sp. Hiyo8]